jgi:hypothetical protein
MGSSALHDKQTLQRKKSDTSWSIATMASTKRAALLSVTRYFITMMPLTISSGLTCASHPTTPAWVMEHGSEAAHEDAR